MFRRKEVRCSVGVLERLFERTFLNFIGSGGAFENENTTAYRLSGDTLLLIDIGELNVHKIIDFIKFKTEITKVEIVITHMHMDHVGGLSTLLYYMHYKMPNIKNVSIVCGEGVNVLDYLKLSGITPSVFDYDKNLYTVEDGCAIVTINNNIEMVEITLHKTKHVSTMESYSLLLKSFKPDSGFHSEASKRVFYSGDTNVIFRNNIGFVDEWYQDVSLVQTPAHVSYHSFLGDILYKPRPTKTFAIHNTKFKPTIEFMSLDRLLDIQSDTTRALCSVQIPFELKPEMIFDVNPSVGEKDKLRFHKDIIKMVPVENFKLRDGAGMVLVKVYHEGLLHAVSVVYYYTNTHQDMHTKNIFTILTNSNTRNIIEEFGCVSLAFEETEYGNDWESKHIHELHEELAEHIRKYRL